MRHRLTIPLLTLTLLLLAPLSLAAGFFAGSIFVRSQAIEGVEVRWKGWPVQIPPHVSLSRERKLEDGTRESVQRKVHADGGVSLAMPHWDPNSLTFSQSNVEFRIDVAESRRIFDLAQRSGLSRHDDVPPLIGFRWWMGTPPWEKCETRTHFILAWVFRRGSRIYWYDRDFCAESAPPGVAPLLEVLNRLADEGVRRAKGGAK